MMRRESDGEMLLRERRYQIEDAGLPSKWPMTLYRAGGQPLLKVYAVPSTSP